MLRVFALFSVTSFEPARSYAVVPLASSRRHCQLGLSASTAFAYGDAGGAPDGIVAVAGGPDDRVAERIRDADAVGLAGTGRCGRVEEAERRSVPPRRAVGLEGLDHRRGRGRRAAQHVDVRCALSRSHAAVQPMRTVPGPRGVTTGVSSAEVLDGIDDSSRSLAWRTGRGLAGSCR